MFGGVRFGGTLTVEDAFALGFDHIALCAGAGKPTVLDMPNGLARGVRTASDFLMALQLTGAAQAGSIANLQMRLPIVVVIGGGLTAIDTATESLAYYPVQVEKFLARYETLVAERSAGDVRNDWNAEETAIAEEFLAHARAIRAEREAAAREGREPRILELLQSWGGVDHRLPQAPDRQPLVHAEPRGSGEGARGRHPLRRGLTPLRSRGRRATAMRSALRVAEAPVRRRGSSLPARTILVAAGTQPNTVLAREDAGPLRARRPVLPRLRRERRRR